MTQSILKIRHQETVERENEKLSDNYQGQRNRILETLFNICQVEVNQKRHEV